MVDNDRFLGMDGDGEGVRSLLVPVWVRRVRGMLVAELGRE